MARYGTIWMDWKMEEWRARGKTGQDKQALYITNGKLMTKRGRKVFTASEGRGTACTGRIIHVDTSKKPSWKCWLATASMVDGVPRMQRSKMEIGNICTDNLAPDNGTCAAYECNLHIQWRFPAFRQEENGLQTMIDTMIVACNCCIGYRRKGSNINSNQIGCRRPVVGQLALQDFLSPATFVCSSLSLTPKGKAMDRSQG